MGIYFLGPEHKFPSLTFPVLIINVKYLLYGRYFAKAISLDFPCVSEKRVTVSFCPSAIR